MSTPAGEGLLLAERDSGEGDDGLRGASVGAGVPVGTNGVNFGAGVAAGVGGVKLGT
jgi:hypothetical protein